MSGSRIVSLLVLASFFLMLLPLSACAQKQTSAPESEYADEADAPVTLSTESPEKTSPVPAVSPTPEPEMTIDEDGDITLRSDIAARFSSAQYPFDHTPSVLIYHTHVTEAYLKTETVTYTETETGRTLDSRYNVVAVGEALAEALRDRGFNVIHDGSDVEGDDITSAYSRSLAIMQQYDGIDLYIDLHRNASKQRGRSDNTIAIDGTPAAKLFFVVGTGIGTYDGEYDVLPDWENNYTFALSLTEAIAGVQPGLVKPIRLKVGRFNQHMGLCLLAEIGTNADTLDAALNTVPYLADAIASVCPVTPD